MKTSFSRTSVISILLIVTVILLGTNIIVEKYFEHLKSVSAKGLPSDLINKRFLIALTNYNIDSSWISEKDLSRDKKDSLKYSYNVGIPADLPASLIIKEITDQFDTNEVNIYAADDQTESSVVIKIYTSGYLKLSSSIKNNNLLHRHADSLAFLITGIEELNSENFNNLLIMPEQFACVMLPSKRAVDISKMLIEEQKQTAILLNDDITELEFKLNSSYSKNRIKNSLKSISGTFNNASFYIFDKNSDVYNSEHSEAINSWFSEKKLVPLNKFSEIEFSSAENMIAQIKSGQGEKRLYKISAEDFLEMSPVLASLRKLGYRIVFPSLLIRTLI